MTLEKFGERVGVTKQTVSRIENGVNALTEQMLLSICREFDVNEDWLRTGEGEMFKERSLSEEVGYYVEDLLSYDGRGISLHIIYSFQPRKSKYKGSSAAEEELKRL